MCTKAEDDVLADSKKIRANLQKVTHLTDEKKSLLQFFSKVYVDAISY